MRKSASPRGRPFRKGYDGRRDQALRHPSLTSRQDQFCREYLIDLNASAAARRAGYSEKSAGRQAQENLQKPLIQARIKELMAERAERVQVKADQVLEELAKVAFSDIRDVVTWDGTGLRVSPSDEISDAAAGAIKRVRVRGNAQQSAERGDGKVRSVEVVLHDKLQALALLTRHLGMDARTQAQPNVVVIAPEKLSTEEWMRRYGGADGSPPAESMLLYE